ncbi:MAG: hypothetical protein FH749_15515 [Firmicutes bacterium]|nr:hypothetical protein [Bacillota bacterium]
MNLTFRILTIVCVVLLVVTVGVNILQRFTQNVDHCCCESRDLYLRQPPLFGPDVLELQLRLKTLGYFTGDADGVYDSRTAEAVRAAQRDLGVPVDGIARVEFWHLLYHGEDATDHEELAPPEGELHIEIYLHKLELTVFSDGEPYVTYPISPGRPATPSPMGEWRIVDKSYRPNDAFGTRWMRLSVPWGGYGVHGTNAPWSIGTVASLGCIRMYNKDVETIYPWIPIGTKVIITGNYHVTFKTPYRRGRVGQDVVLVQWAMRDLGFCPGEANGTFDEEMEAAVKEMQEFFGLEPTGIIGDTEFWLLGVQ